MNKNDTTVVTGNTRMRRTAAAALAIAMLASVKPATADMPINVSIGPGFDWSGKAIRKIAASSARVFGDRCIPPCTINIQIVMSDTAYKTSGKRVKWLKKAILSALEPKDVNDVRFVETLVAT